MEIDGQMVRALAAAVEAMQSLDRTFAKTLGDAYEELSLRLVISVDGDPAYGVQQSQGEWVVRAK